MNMKIESLQTLKEKASKVLLHECTYVSYIFKNAITWKTLGKYSL